MSDFSTIKAQLQALIDTANAKTGNTDYDLTTAVGALVDGYGVGGDEEVILDSTGVAFSSEQVDPDVNYKVGQNWLADLVAVVQNMAGKAQSMTLDDVLYWLNRVQFIPQGNAESSFALSFSSIASGILPEVQIGTAVSEFSISFTSNAAGELVETIEEE